KKKTSSSKPVSEPVAPPTFAPAPPTTIPSAPPSSLYGPIYADLDFSQATPTTSTVPAPKTTDKGITEFEQYSSRGQQQRTGNTSHTQLQQQQPAPQVNGASPLCSTLNRLIDQFNQRMENVSGKGLSIATDQAILSLHQDLTALHIQLLQQIDETQEKKSDQERFLHKLEESKEARITFDTMKRRHDEQLLQQEREQQALAQMQVQMKLALLRQQKAEQMAYGQSMQSERLNRLSNQRAEYEKTLAIQRENERLKLITLEEQVYKQQFGGVGGGTVGMETAPYGAPPPSLYNAPPPSMAPPPPVEPYGAPGTSYAGPLPPKVDPPTYQPISGYQQLPVSAYSHPPPTQPGPPPTHYQPPTLYQPPDLGPPPPNYSYSSPYGAPPSMAPSTLAAPPYGPSSSTEVPLFQPNEGFPPSEIQRVPSVPPLISFD
uniref:Hepatocyte growth factor-regulated tyrosine kinase substrate helical domain-containing protein n=2 Tax=Amphimedon queenslandica TaxID=400682 RepID=A0A1X7T1J8_AMPQE